jgi:hypothetical protein
MQFSVPLAVANVVLASAFWPGGTGVIVAAATSFGTASLTLQYLLPDLATFFTITAVTAITANGISAQFTLPAGMIRLANGGAGSAGLVANAQIIPTNLN